MEEDSVERREGTEQWELPCPLEGICASAGTLELSVGVGDARARIWAALLPRRIPGRNVHTYSREAYDDVLRSVIPDSPEPEIAQTLTNNRMEN